MKTKIPLFQIDAFTDEAFTGNPAAICVLEQEYSDEILQKIAAEMNLSETAFLYISNKEEIVNQKNFKLRWFTPQVEVDLCGHATLATSAILFFYYKIRADEVSFITRSGELKAKKQDNQVILNFPSNAPKKVSIQNDLLNALGVESILNAAYSDKVTDLLIEVENSEIVRNLKPNFSKLVNISFNKDIRGIVVTSKGFDKFDFVSRFFAPWVGINEDPVTGSAHTILTPYWFDKLGKKEMKACQLSTRGGELIVRLSEGNCVEIIGKTKLIFEGFLYL